MQHIASFLLITVTSLNEHEPLRTSTTTYQRIARRNGFQNHVVSLYDFMDESYDKWSDEELMEEVKEYYPELLEDS